MSFLASLAGSAWRGYWGHFPVHCADFAAKLSAQRRSGPQRALSRGSRREARGRTSTDRSQNCEWVRRPAERDRAVLDGAEQRCGCSGLPRRPAPAQRRTHASKAGVVRDWRSGDITGWFRGSWGRGVEALRRLSGWCTTGTTTERRHAEGGVGQIWVGYQRVYVKPLPRLLLQYYYYYYRTQ